MSELPLATPRVPGPVDPGRADGAQRVVPRPDESVRAFFERFAWDGIPLDPKSLSARDFLANF
ncbi:MAG: hypothetical protein Q8Q09_19130 [Deltaproteobacteria bacterium]|nr:hypothetical protein [Deltaproteobacteria bacterium]